MVGSSSTVWLRRQRQVTSARSVPSSESATEAISDAVSIESSTLLEAVDEGVFDQGVVNSILRETYFANPWPSAESDSK